MTKKSNTCEGFTIVELLITMVVTTIVMLIITNFMLGNMEQSVLEAIKGNILQQTTIGLDKINNDIRSASGSDTNNIWPDPNSPSGTANEYSWTSNSSTLILSTPVISTSGNILFTNSSDYTTEKNNIVYFVNNGNLYKRTIANPIANNAMQTSCPRAVSSPSCPADIKILSNVTQFNVSYLNGQNQAVAPSQARSIKLLITVSKSMYNKPVSVTYTTQMVFRNG